MKLTTENTKEFIEFWNKNKPEKFVHPMYKGIATVILDYLDQAEYQLTLEDNKITVFDQQTNEELGEYTPEELFWKARLLIESNDKGSRSSTNHYNNLLDIFADEKLNPEDYKNEIRKELYDYYLTDNFDINDELNWNSIDHTTKSWITVDGIYYEKEDSGLYLAKEYSITDLENKYGDSFPEKAIEDGVLFKFDEYYQIDEHIAVSNDLKTHEEIEDLLYDYEYQTEDILKYYIPQLTDKQAEILDLIIYKQDIDIETIKELKKLSFENIYEEIDISLLSEEEKQALEEIKKELEKPHFEIEKHLFDSFIQIISTAAADSIKKNLESIKANAMYVYTNDGSEFSIISKRKSDNTYMVHKYYPENETGGIHHGSYDIKTEKEAEKAAISKLIGMDSNEAVIELNNFIAGSPEEEFNKILKDDLASVFEYVNEYVANKDEQITLKDVKAYNYSDSNGKLKVLVEYEGNFREDDLFNILNEEDEVLGLRAINGCVLDLNPINPEKSGTISEYLDHLSKLEESRDNQKSYFCRINEKGDRSTTFVDFTADNKSELYTQIAKYFESVKYNSSVERTFEDTVLREEFYKWRSANYSILFPSQGYHHVTQNSGNVTPENDLYFITKNEEYSFVDINDLQSFFMAYPQMSEALGYQILDDFKLYKLPLVKDNDGNIYQRDELQDGELIKLTQDGIIDQEYNWLIDRKYTSEDEIDFQKELENIKKFEENPKSYYKNIFKIALEKEIEKVKKEINEGNIKDVIEKNILEIAEEKVGSHAVPEEIIGWYISDDEKNYFENWKISGDFPYYKEALDSMFAYVYEHDTTKQNLRYISELNEITQNELRQLLKEHFESEGLTESEIEKAIENAMNSKIDDLNQLMESNEKINKLLLVEINEEPMNKYKKMQNTSIEVKENKQKFFGAIELWNNNKQGTNSEFKPIGTLVEVNPSDEQQCESLRKNTSFIDIYDAELILGMINYDKDSFEFMLDIDNGNFVEIDRKNNKIIDVTDTEGALRYLRDEINYRTQDVVEESFTVEEIAAANRLIRPLEFIDNKNRQKTLEKNIYVVEEGVVTGSREPSFVPYNEFASKRLLDKTFTTKEACEIFCRKENAFQIAKAHIDEVDNSKEYSEAEKEKYVKVYFEQLEKNWDEYDNQAPSYRELAILIKGLDAFNHGEESLTFTRPNADDIEIGFDNGWDFSEICKGYAEFADGYNESNVICRLDDMMIFDSDSDAALQAKKDGYQFLEVGKDIIFPEEMLDADIEYRNYIDTPKNRKLLSSVLSKDLVKEIEENYKNKKQMSFGQFSDSGELKLIKDAKFKELIIDENKPENNKVIFSFTEDGKEKNLEMKESEYNKILDAFGILEEQKNKAWEIQKYSQIAEKEPQKIFEEIKNYSFWEEDNKLTGYLKGLSKNNNIHHYLDELLFESCIKSDENLFCKVVDAGADITWRREENGEPINILHYAAADNLSTAIKKIIEKTRTLTAEDNVELYSEQNFVGETPFVVSINNFDGENYKSQSLLLDAMLDEGFSGVKDLLFVDRVGTKVLYSQNDYGSMQILCFDNDNNILNADFNTVLDEKSYGECLFENLSFQLSKDGRLYNAQLNNSKKLIAELKEIPQKLWDDDINYKILHELPRTFDPKQNFHDFDSILDLEKVKKYLASDFEKSKESILQGNFSKEEFTNRFTEKKIQELFSEKNNPSDFVKFFNDDNWSPLYPYYKEQIAETIWDNEIELLRNSISPKPNLFFMLRDKDASSFLNLLKKDSNVNINEEQAEILLKYLQYEDYNFYTSVNGDVCLLDVSEDFTGEGEIMTPEKIVDMAHRMMVKACDLEYSIYEEKDEVVICNLKKKFEREFDVGIIKVENIIKSKDSINFQLLVNENSDLGKIFDDNTNFINNSYYTIDFVIGNNGQFVSLKGYVDENSNYEIELTDEKIVSADKLDTIKKQCIKQILKDYSNDKNICNLINKLNSIEKGKKELPVVDLFFTKLKDSLYDNAKLEDVLKSAATVLQTFSDTEKKEISQYLHNKGASSGDRVGKVLSSILEINEQKQTKKRSKTDDDTRGM